MGNEDFGNVCIMNIKTGIKKRIIEKADNISNITQNDQFSFIKDDQLWTTNTEGKDLTLTLTQRPEHYFWNPDGSLLCFNDSYASRFFYFLKNNDTVRTDFVRSRNAAWDYTGTKTASWQLDRSETFSQLAIFDTLTKNTQLIPGCISEFAGGLLTWSRDNQFLFWSSQKGLFKTEWETGATTQLRVFCWSRGYKIMQVSPDNEKLLCIRVDKKEKKGQGDNVKPYLIEMNIDGTHERRIDF